MAPILFSIGSVNIYGYGLCLAVGILVAYLVAMNRVKRYHMDEDLYTNGILVGILAGLVGAKVLYWIVEIDSVIANPEILLDFADGFVFYGGAIAGVLAPFIYVKVKKQTFIDKLDVVIPCIPLAQMFGRIGCYLSGCCYGAEAPEGAWYTSVFPTGSSAPAGVGLYPTQLISAIGLGLIFVILCLIARKQKFAGQITSVFMIIYSIGRFLVEFLRNDPRGTVGPFSTSQFISIFILLVGIIFFVVLSGKNIPVPSTKAVPVAEPSTEPEAAPEEKTAAETITETVEEKAEEIVEEVTEEKKENA